ncbi:MmgE/PrpD family protein [Pseudorhizobium flavum]|uniref:2-methylcitrate dehydratase PrpD n=1 Tax=Pseudorhizobium flavum TaxID=1335061 RepID=A0A7W9Z0S2_9HYPH|nr:MmgE/PrpD family protein [Pseudorhizobium flavum]MBB6181943.1 2-methylcitrate dehydratase PrpD [Pseudorhizobium flavum]CAD6628705.1 MmgE/PrpD family protein [Pseudorhizobium flavum]
MNIHSSGTSVAFAKDVLGIGQRGLRDADREQLRRLLLDCYGVSRVGAAQPWSVSLGTWARRFSGAGKAPVISTNIFAPPMTAAFVNGTAAHGYELDDTHEASMSHPGSVVIPAALAVAAERDCAMEETLVAIACGYEVMARLGMAARVNDIIHDGFHPTALFGPFGSATAAGVLMELDEYDLCRAWGHALSLTGGSMQFSDETTGTAVKRLHAGYAAQNGVLAAEMAGCGIEAPHAALDGKYGFLALFARHPDPSLLRVNEDDELQIHRTSFKPYACCRLFHAAIDCIEAIRHESGQAHAAITGITVRAPGVVAEQHMLQNPGTAMAAQYSLPFVAAATAIYGPHRHDIYQDDKLGDPAIKALADRVKCVADPDIEAAYPAQMGSSVDIRFADGTVHTRTLMDCLGTAANPMSTDALCGKAAGLLRMAGPATDAQAARCMIWSESRGRALAALFAH